MERVISRVFFKIFKVGNFKNKQARNKLIIILIMMMMMMVMMMIIIIMTMIMIIIILLMCGDCLAEG